MATKPQRRMLLSLTFLTLALPGNGAHAQGIPIVTGEQWVVSSDDVKKAYLIGIANLLDVERAYYGANPPSDSQAIAPRFTKGMQGQTLHGVRQQLDVWYAANPTMIQHPVIETLWFQIVQPGLKKNP